MKVGLFPLGVLMSCAMAMVVSAQTPPVASEVYDKQLHLEIAKAMPAFLALVGVVLTLFFQRKQANKTDAKLADIEALISKHRRRPLEGEWDFKVDYDRFHEISPETAQYHTAGGAIFAWNTEGHFYSIIVFASSYAISEPGTSLVTSVLRGRYDPDGKGDHPSQLELTYEKRTAVEKFRFLGTAGTFLYRNLKVTQRNEGREIISMEGVFESNRSRGKVRFVRKK